ncbi:MAG TPA: hypothetical protein VI410_03295 [Anaerolineales bacterium]|nr:hypothetical protein [Anaerolineales bacterium]
MNTTAFTNFRPDRVAYFEAAGWQAYYDHNWPRAFRLMVSLNREEFRMPLLTAVAAALDIVRASIAFAPADNDVPKATKYVRRYYEKARRSSDLKTDAQTLSDLEMRYWVVHRELALERIQQPEKENLSPMVEALTDLHATIFEVSPQAARRSAELRALAAKTVDRITGRYSTDVAGDWRQAEAYLKQAYRAVLEQ